MEGVLGVLGTVLAIVLFVLRSRASKAPSRKDKEIDNAFAKGHNAISSVTHDTIDRLRHKDPSI